MILSQTLQAMRHIEAIVDEMLRVGREAIVSFPNFGHWSHRLQILRGRMPVSEALPYQWYDTPNIHLCTVADFDALPRRARLSHRRARRARATGAPVDVAAEPLRRARDLPLPPRVARRAQPAPADFGRLSARIEALSNVAKATHKA